MGEKANVGQINDTWVVETYIGQTYTTGGILLASQKLGNVQEAYPLPPLIGALGGTLVVFPQVLVAHGMVSNQTGSLGIAVQPSVGTIAGSIVATIAATLAPNQFLVKAYTAAAGSLTEVGNATAISAALTFLERGS